MPPACPRIVRGTIRPFTPSRGRRVLKGPYAQNRPDWRHQLGIDRALLPPPQQGRAEAPRHRLFGTDHPRKPELLRAVAADDARAMGPCEVRADLLGAAAPGRGRDRADDRGQFDAPDRRGYRGRGVDSADSYRR